MQKRNWKSIALTVASVLVLGIVVLAIHIWWVMKPQSRWQDEDHGADRYQPAYGAGRCR